MKTFYIFGEGEGSARRYGIIWQDTRATRTIAQLKKFAAQENAQLAIPESDLIHFKGPNDDPPATDRKD